MLPKVYRADRGRKLVVASGGSIEVQTGGAIDMDGEIVQSIEFDTDYFTVTEGVVTLKAEVAALLEIVGDIPTVDPEDDGVTIWNDNGALKVSGASE